VETSRPATAVTMDVDGMSVRELRSVISRAGMSSADCIEKPELRQRARQALATAADPSPMSAAPASHLQAALNAVKQELSSCTDEHVVPSGPATQQLPAQAGGDRPSLSVSPPRDPPVSILGLENQYQELGQVYAQLLARELSTSELIGGDVAPNTISGVDFAEPLDPLPDDVPLSTGSDANKFAMLVWRMFDACNSGSIGGDACRLADVLAAATNDALAKKALTPRFHHLLGLILAISNHGLRSWILRGDKDLGEQVFRLVGNAWKKMFALPADTLASAGINAELRKLAVDWCEETRKYLRSFGGKDWEGTFANVFTFSYIVKPRAKRPAAPAASAGAAASKRRKQGTPAPAAAGAPPPSESELAELRATISRRLQDAIKRTVHSERNKPATTVEVPVSSPALAAGVLLGGSSTPTNNKRQFAGAGQLLEWLPTLPKTVHPVANKVKTLGMVGGSFDVYAWAGFLSADASYVKSKNVLKLKVKTQVVGYGKPSAFADGDAHFDGYVACSASAPALKKWIADKEME
jgi:hypothetical protein